MTDTTLDIIAQETAIAAEAGNQRLNAQIAAEQLKQILPDPEAFEKFFKAKSTKPEQLNAGNWGFEPSKGLYGTVTPDGSVITLRFFDTVKRIFDMSNTEVPGRESYLCYVEVVVRPAGAKPYLFKAFGSQQVWANGQVTALAKHEAAKEKLKARFKPLGIDIQDNEWDTRFDRSTGN